MMKNSNAPSLYIVWAGLAWTVATTLHAANPPQAGAISGRVQLNSGQYISNATVTVQGRGISAVTDQFGVYRLPDVPSGRVSLQVTYTGQDPFEASFNLSPGESLTHDITLRPVGSSVVTMQRFNVNEREVIAEEIATHEQKSETNIQNVNATDDLGDITGGHLRHLLPHDSSRPVDS